MSKKGQFEVITGLWRRTKSGNRGEEYYYGKPKLSKALTINNGDEIDSSSYRSSSKQITGSNPFMNQDCLETLARSSSIQNL